MASWLVFYMLFFLAVPVRVAMATPEGGVFTVGTGAINPVVGGDTTVVVNQAKSVIEWGQPWCRRDRYQPGRKSVVFTN